MKTHMRTLGMVLLTLVCLFVAIVVNLGPPTWLRKLMGQETAVATAPTTAPVVHPEDLQRAEERDGLKLVWSDEFGGAAGGAPDPSRWKVETGTPSTGELEHNTAKNVKLDGKGRLVITARKQKAQGKDYTSARITSEGNFETTYGRFTARIKTSNGQGLWPAFWLLGNDFREHPWPECGEIDIMERRGDLTDRSYATLQGPGFEGVGISKQYSLGKGKDFSKKFHVFTLDWTPTEMVFMVDDYVVQTIEKATLPGKWVFDHPFFLVLNLALGGPFPGAPDETTRFPAKMVVDYVRAYTLPGVQAPAS